MRLGILDAVPPEFLAVDDYISDAQKFIDLLAAVDFAGEIVVYNVGAGEFPPHLTACDAYLITGSPVSVYDPHPWIETLLAFIRTAHQAQKPMVGICFGHQAVAQALGGRVEPAPTGWLLGLKALEVLEVAPWMQPQAQAPQIYYINQDQVLKLPPEATRLASTENCENSLYTIGQHILCMQGHPEQPLRAMKNFIADLVEIIPPEVQHAADQSFRQAEPDYLLVGGWIRSFLTAQPESETQ